MRKLDIFKISRGSVKIFKTTKEKLFANKDDFEGKFNNELTSIKKHIFNVKNQYETYRICVNNLEPNEAALHIDFSENYNCKFAEEIQGHHFGGSRKQITLHTGVLYLPSQNPYSFCTISANNEHGPSAIWAHLNPVLKMLKEEQPNIRTIHFFSDGPATQYRQKQNFYLFSKNLHGLGFDQATWSFFESGHGKGAADGIGGVLKRTADRIVAHGEDISNAETFFDLVQKETSVMLFKVGTEQIEKIKASLPDKIPVLKGTMTLHQLMLREKSMIQYRDISCFCANNNFGRGFCDCYQPKQYSCVPKNKKNINYL